VALSGTISDFGLGDIFQLIGIQRKTGELRLRNDDDTVTVQFMEGQVVGADTKSQSVEDLLGAVLVRTGRITDDQLKKALSLQRKTLQRLGHILVKQRFINEEELVEALRVQSLQIVYRLFRWRSGQYEFAASENLDYDQKHFVPISAETILMEGARMIDEWPLIERRIRSDSVVLRRTEKYADLEVTLADEAPLDVGEEFDFVFDQQAADEKPAQPEGESSPLDDLSSEERLMLSFVDGQRSVIQINDCVNMGEFDTSRILADLVTKHWIEEIKRPNAGEVARGKRQLPERAFHGIAAVVLCALALLSIQTLPTNRWTPWQQGLADPATETLQHLVCQQRLERLEAGIQTYYLDHGAFPDALQTLAIGPYILAADLIDPWNRPFHYEISSGGYRIAAEPLAGGDEDGSAPSHDLLHRFTAVERMMHLPAESAEQP